MKIIYEGTDVFPDVSVSSCIHTMYAQGQSDSVIVKFNDTRKLWDLWGPKIGDAVTISEGAASTGKMYVNSVMPENGLIVLQALSCPSSGFVLTNAAWEKVYLSRILQDIADRNKLTLDRYGVEDHLYRYVVQRKSDYEFLNERLSLECYAFLVFDGRLVVYSEPEIEKSDPLKTIRVSADTDFEFQDNSASGYSSAFVQCGIYTGSYTLPDTAGGRTLNVTLTTQAGSGPESNRFAMGILRNANKKLCGGYVVQNFLPDIAAGSMINLESEKDVSWNGKVFLHSVRHDYVMGITKLFFRRPLTGY